MRIYKVELEVTFRVEIEVFAESENEASEVAESRYEDNSIVIPDSIDPPRVES